MKLLTAVRNRDVPLVRSLLASGVDPNVVFGEGNPAILKDSDGGWPSFYREFTPLHVLALSASNSTVREAGPRQGDHSLNSAKQLAIAVILLRKGADIGAQDGGGNDPLDIALAQRSDELARLLIIIQHSKNHAVHHASLPPLSDCMPNMPKTLTLVLELGDTALEESNPNFLTRILIENRDWVSLRVLLSALPDMSLDRSHLRDFRSSRSNSKDETGKLAELQTLLKTKIEER